MSNNNQKPAEQANLGEALSRTEQFFTNNKKGIIAALAAIIVIVVGIFVIKSTVIEPRQTKAAEALFPGEQYFNSNEYQKALDGDDYGYQGLVAVAKQYKGTKAAKLANAYAGICYAQLEDYSSAIAYLSKFSAKDKTVTPSVLGALANCYAETDQLDKAGATFLAAAKKANDKLFTPYFLLQAGIIFESAGNQAKALDCYNRIKNSYSASAQASDADKYITRINAVK